MGMGMGMGMANPLIICSSSSSLIRIRLRLINKLLLILKNRSRSTCLYLSLSLLLLLFLVPSLFLLSVPLSSNSDSISNHQYYSSPPPPLNLNLDLDLNLNINPNLDHRHYSLLISNNLSSFPPPSEPPQLPLIKSVSSSSSSSDPESEWWNNNNYKCNLYDGRWEKDDEGGRYPLYAPGSCPYVDDAYACQLNGRQDGDFLNWRWTPNHCHLPRFSATDFLERLRGKRFMLVGDSMNRNQFESLLCLLREALPDKTKMFETHGYKISKGRGYFVFHFVDYNCTVEFVRSHFLVREGKHIDGRGNSNPTLEIDRIDKSANRWKKANILVFNTGHWWTHGKTAKGKNYYKEGDVLYPQFDAVDAFKRALRTWGRWIDENINHNRTIVFYRGYSAAHFRGGDWDSGGTCNGETEPVRSGAIINSYPLKMKIVEEIIDEMKYPVVFLNVTKLTNFRKDGHPSIYGKSVIPGQKVSARRQDCSHWCLPGVPDVWNELIYATLVLKGTQR